MTKKKYIPITKAQAAKAVQWFGELCGIGGWDITLFVQDNPPHRWDLNSTYAACCRIDREHKAADIWISNAICRHSGRDILVDLFHECQHWLWSDIDIHGDSTGPAEFAWNRLARALAFAYRHKMKVKA